MRRFEFVVYDQPKPLSRPRVNRKTGHFYLPQKDQGARFQIRAAFLSLPEVVADTFAEGDGFKPLLGPLRLTVTAWLKMPGDIPKKRLLTALPGRRPDLDNYIKQVEDALQGYAFLDDSQIVTIEARKRYAGGTGPASPCWAIILDQIDETA